ncbi:hypothetical protein V6Z12_A06G194300 [Gossypium hirsutum]
MANFADSTAADCGNPSFSGSHLIQMFPCHNTVKLDNKNFMQWLQHIQLIIESYELLEFLEGTLPVPPSFISSLDRVLTLNLDASLYVQQDKLLASSLLSTISFSLLSFFIAAKLMCEVWSIANHLFVTATGIKLSRINYDLY